MTEVFSNGTGTLGKASLHFKESAVGSDQSYISFSEDDISSNLLNGESPPDKVFFQNSNFDEASRTFSGDINWVDNAFDGDTKWVFVLTFSEDFLAVDSGSKYCFDADGVLTYTFQIG